MAVSWDSYYAEFLEMPVADREARLKALASGIRELFHAAGDTNIKWLQQALTDEKKKWFVAHLFYTLDLDPPESLYPALIRAAVYEGDPSFNKYFIQPLIRPFGHRRVNETLLDWFQNGSNVEKAGIVRALYWTGAPESRAAYDALKDVWQRKRELFIKEFVSNSDLDVRQNLIANLQLDPSYYSIEFKPLINQAIGIAQDSNDPYIIQRLKIELEEKW